MPEVVDLKESLTESRDLGPSHILASTGLYLTGRLNIVEDLYRRLQQSGSLSEEERSMFENEVLELFTDFQLAEEHSRHSDDPKFSITRDQAKSSLEHVANTTGREREAVADMAHIVMALRHEDYESAKAACDAFKDNSLNTFAVDLPRNLDKTVKFEDGTEQTLHRFLGYNTPEEMHDTSSRDRNERFVNSFRGVGLNDDAIANLIMSFNQKSFMSGDAYLSQLSSRANPGNIPQPGHPDPVINIDRTTRQVTLSSTGNISLRSMENPEEVTPALISTWSYTIPMGNPGNSTKSFDQLFESSVGYNVQPTEAEVIMLPRIDFNPPVLTKSVRTRPITLTELDHALPPLNRENFSIREITQTFKELFNLQRGGTFTRGIEGRMLQIVNDERRQNRLRPIKSLEGVQITENHVHQLVDRLAVEQQGHQQEIDLAQVKEQTVKAVTVRARLNEVNPDTHLPPYSNGPGFRRFNSFGEFWSKIKQFFSLINASRNIEDTIAENGASTNSQVHLSHTPASGAQRSTSERSR